MVPPTIEELSGLFPDLEIESLIGQGGMGAVFRARQKKLDRVVALKVLPREISGNRDFARRFLREARALARLSHPSIVGVHEYGETDGICWLLLEYVDGSNLRGILRSGLMDSRQALALVRDLCDALQYAHDEGVVHRDIKPENVLVDRRGRAKVADFGLAKLIGPVQDAHLTREGQVMGTPHYMAPEQIERPREVDHRADIYALGVVLYEMLTGSLPRGNFEPPSRRVHVDVRLDEIVLKALEHEPSRRYQHAVDVKTDVDAVGDGSRAETGPTVAPAHDPAQGKAEGFGFHAELGGPGLPVRTLTWPRAHVEDAPVVRDHGAKNDPLRGWFGLFFDVALWLMIAASLNLGPEGFGCAIVGAIVLYAVRIYCRLRIRPELAAALAGERMWQRVRRQVEAFLTAVVGIALVALGHLAWWERGVASWSPAFRTVDGMLDSVRGNLWSFVPASLRMDPTVSLRLEMVSPRASVGLGDLSTAYALALFAAGLLVCMFAMLVAVRPVKGKGLRAHYWLIASDLAGRWALALGVLWCVGAVVQMRTGVHLTSTARTFRAAASLDEVERIVCDDRSNIDVEQHAVVTDERTGAVHAEVLVLRASPRFFETPSWVWPLESWRMTWTGPIHRGGSTWVRATHVRGSDEVEILVDPGLYPPQSPAARNAQDFGEWIERSTSELRR